MPRPNLSRMTVEALLDLRMRLDESLLDHRAELQGQLDRLQGASSLPGRSPIRKRKSKLKGAKVHPSIAVVPARLGRVEGHDHGGLSRR
jgi:hypothetical protein